MAENENAQGLNSLCLSSSSKVEVLADDWIDHHIDDHHVFTKPELDKQSLKQVLERKYLSPPTKFSSQWLNQLQQ